MAARKKLRQTDETRAKIQTSQLINRLTAYAFGEITLEASQVRAIEVLLRKTLPDLTSTALTDADGGPLQISVVKFSEEKVEIK